MRILLCIFFLLITIQINCNGQSVEKFKVFLYYNLENDTDKNLIKSYFERELRKLGDVEIVDYNLYSSSSFVFALDCYLVSAKLNDENKTIIGYTMFTTFAVKLEDERDKLPTYLGATWQSADIKGIEDIAISIIADFDQRILNGYRKLK